MKLDGMILVTGATGFLGSNLVRELVKRGYKVRIVRRRNSTHPFLEGINIESFEGDILDIDSLHRAMKGCAVVIHCAGYVSYNKIDAELMRRVNIDGTLNVCEAALSSRMKKLVHISSTAAVGIPQDPGIPLNEAAHFNRKWNKIPYMQTKNESEVIALEYIKRGLDVVTANPSTFIGEGDIKMNSGVLFRNISEGNLKAAPPGGLGVIGIRDCVDGIIKVFERGKSGNKYILNSQNVTFLEFFNVIASKAGVKSIRKKIPRLMFIPALTTAILVEKLFAIFGKKSRLTSDLVKISWAYRYFDSTKAKTELGWRTTQTLEDSCADAINFYRKQNLV